MPKKSSTHPSSHPDTAKEPRVVARLKFSGYDHQTKEKYLSRFSFVWNEAGLNRFEKSFSVLRRCYREPWSERPPLMNHLHHIVWLDLCGYAWDGVLFTKASLSEKYAMHYDTLTEIIDHLEDINLLHRVRLADVQGRPIQHVMMTPLTEDKYNAGSCVRLYEQKGTARKRRKLLGHNNYPERVIEVNGLLRACGDGETAQRLEDIVADIVYKSRPKILNRESFFAQFNKAAMANKIPLNERLHALAWQRKELYSNELLKMS
jgi:hypothetical protein